MSSVLITGSSRGLGLELVKQLALRTIGVDLIVATARECSAALEDVIAHTDGRVLFVSLDVSNLESITRSVEQVRSALGQRRLDILINCAGVHSDTPGGVAHMTDLEYQLSVNVSGAHNVIRSYISLMETGEGKKIVNISTAYASITRAAEVSYAPCPAYKISKAALNALTVQYAMSYQDAGFIFLAVSPGWLQTDMGGTDADLTVEEGAKAVVDVVMSADKDCNGRFKNIQVPRWAAYDGLDIPW
ncbi:hydroxyacyl dehydrogenase [Aspergillus sclerotioniger CBS 115572]|uniref:Hydroxyacyl dehydrogenase n=1 Tax=Aspergillus sclerotioniger CBS 115572 TaxID=1450535 RepID=A0A317V8K4_9EURO|nr:hydroxyacyl dehydrogenase [Aspergillus sclerotioniger CBS 115572]PWY69631.1 hydroxyacyl dehydrogenase [Aspergillus sclerotioniger CBS 115572]